MQLSKNAAYVLKILKYSLWNIFLKYDRDDVILIYFYQNVWYTGIKSLVFLVFCFLFFLIMRPGHKASDKKTP